MWTRWFPISLVSLLAVPMAQVEARDIMEMPVDTVVKNSVTIGNKQVPLLKGDWKILQSDGSLHRASGAPIGGVVLVRAGGDAAVYIYTNLDIARAGGWKRSRSVCDRDNVHFNQSDKNYNPQEADCWQVNHYVNTYSTKGSAFYNRLKQWMRDNLSTSSLIMLQYFHNDAYDFIWISYYFDPTKFGFPSLLEVSWTGSDWHRYAVRGDPRREGFIEAAKALGEKLHVLIRRGFRKKLDGYVANLDIESPG